jgi:hypothetical protein
VTSNGPPERVPAPYVVPLLNEIWMKSRVVLNCSPNLGDRLLLRLNIYGKPIANKYCEGKMKRTLKRESKDLKSLRRKR